MQSLALTPLRELRRLTLALLMTIEMWLSIGSVSRATAGKYPGQLPSQIHFVSSQAKQSYEARLTRITRGSQSKNLSARTACAPASPQRSAAMGCPVW